MISLCSIMYFASASHDREQHCQNHPLLWACWRWYDAACVFLQAIVWSISYVAVAVLRLLVLSLIGLFRALNVPSHFLICVLRGSPQHCVSYGALSGTMYVCVLWSSLRHYVCVLWSSLRHFFLLWCDFWRSLRHGVTSGALSGTNASTTGLHNLMEATLGHEQPQPRGA